MLFRGTLLPVLLQCVASLAPVQTMTSYTQMNHDEPTNAVKETTVTSQGGGDQEREEFRAPGVGERDLLWDHVGDLSQHLVLGMNEDEDRETTGVPVSQVEHSMGFNQSSTESLAEENVTQGETEQYTVTVHSLPLTTTRGAQVEEMLNGSDVQGKLVLYPTETESNDRSSEALGNITKNLRKSLRPNITSKAQSHPKQIIYDTSDPFSVIFGEVKTEFKTDNSLNISKGDRENIIGGLAVRKVQELLKEEDQEKTTFNGKDSTTTFQKFAVHNFEEERDQYGSEREEQELRHNSELFQFGKIKSSPSEEVLFSKFDLDSNMSNENNELESIEESQSEKNLFKEWDTVSEEQEKMLEDMVLQEHNHLDGSSRDALPPPGRWFILLLAGNSTIVKLRQKDFAKYLKLNLAARLSLEYDEIKVNRVVLAPPRLMVNVSVVPAKEGMNEDLDEEIDLEDKIFGEEEAPLHKLAETNATLLELSGEEYHVVRFLSLRSQQPIQMEDSPSETSMIINDRHMDIEMIIYVVVGGTCALAILVTFVYGVYRYLKTAPINWPWKGAKPLFTAPWNLPRHQRMGEEPAPSIGGPLTVIYSGSFVDRTAAPTSGSWIEDFQPPGVAEPLEVTGRQPVYGFGALSNTALPEICDLPGQESPRYNIDNKLHILGCRPNHLLLPHQPSRTTHDNHNHHKPNHHLDVRIQGVDNPNYMS